MSTTTAANPDKIRLGVSACLLGQPVRYDGSHKYDDFINRHLARFFEFVPVCPEAEAGLGVPRPPLRLVLEEGVVHARGVRDPGLDASAALNAQFAQAEPRLRGICGYIFKKGSPSCGLERVKLYHPNGMPHSQTRGLFAAALTAAWPLLPVEEEGRLQDPALRENFITRVFVTWRWQRLLEQGLRPGRLVEFHSHHKLLVMAHNQAAYRRLGRLVASAGELPLEVLAQDYFAELMRALHRPANSKSHVNVLQHLLGYLKQQIDSGDKQELLDVFESYRQGRLPLVVPITLLKHHFRRHPHPYVSHQVYLDPHPAELMLRNSL